MKKVTIIKLLLVTLLLAAVPDNSKAQRSPLKLPDFLTLELTFGDNNTQEEYLIAGSRFDKYNFAVDDKNNVYVYDEARLKVYDENGKGIALIGGPGEGPGEFPERNIFSLPAVGPSGYVTVQSGAMQRYYNLYDPQHKFVDRVFSKPFRGGTQYQCFVIAFDENMFLGEEYEVIPNGDFLDTKFSLVSEINGEKKILVSYGFTTHVVQGGMEMSIPFLGDLFWTVLPDGTIYYTHSRIDEEYDENGSFYVFNKTNINSGIKGKFRYPFEPQPLSDSEINEGGNFGMSGSGRGDRDAMLSMRADFLRSQNIKNRTAIAQVFFDREYAFVYTYTTERVDRQTNYQVDIIDLVNESYIRSVSLPDPNRIIAIRNGYLYISGRSSDGFLRIEKYKIDPAVYRK